MKTIQDIFFETADSARAVAAYNRAIRPMVRQTMSPSQYLHEFGMCRIACGRGVGASTWIKSRACSDDLIIVPSNYSLDVGEYNALKARITAAVTLKGVLQYHLHFNTVFVDSPTEVFTALKKDEYELAQMLRNVTQEVVMVGM